MKESKRALAGSPPLMVGAEALTAQGAFFEEFLVMARPSFYNSRRRLADPEAFEEARHGWLS